MYVTNLYGHFHYRLTGPILNTEKKDRIKVDWKTITIDLKGNTNYKSNSKQVMLKIKIK